MFSLARCLLVSGIALCVPITAFAQSKADAGSGPTTGVVSPNDAGSGPTPGAKPNPDTTARNSRGTGDRDDVTPGPKSTGGSQPDTPAMPAQKQ
jgi:hypothetical protein